jgi:hypothetical protein
MGYLRLTRGLARGMGACYTDCMTKLLRTVPKRDASKLVELIKRNAAIVAEYEHLP